MILMKMLKKEVFRQAADLAGINPHHVFYVDAIDTKVGDPIEANAIGEVFGGNCSDSLCIGSVKNQAWVIWSVLVSCLVSSSLHRCLTAALLFPTCILFENHVSAVCLVVFNRLVPY